LAAFVKLRSSAAIKKAPRILRSLLTIDESCS
jgi:hypothetical protein